MADVRKLTDAVVRQANMPGKYFDGGGLHLCVTVKRDKSLSRSWAVRFTASDGRAREMGLGAYPEISLAKAREAAAKRRDEARNGVDPLAEKEEARRAREVEEERKVTFAVCGDRYIALHEATWRNAKHRYQWRATLKDYVYPVIGDLPVADVDTTLVLKVLEPIWTTKRETASRVRARMESILNWAATKGYRNRDRQNPAVWRGHLQYILPKRRSRRLVTHMPALPFRDMPDFMPQVRDAHGLAARALEFTILSAARSSETRFARWREIEFRHRIWTIPGERMKAGVEHKTPLSQRALDILEEIKREIAPEQWDANAYIFPGPKPGKPFSDAAMRAVLKRINRSDITVHGFRSTFRDWGAECTDHPPEVIKMALAHIIDDEVDAAYRRGELLQKRTSLMRDWAAYCHSRGFEEGARAGRAA